MSSDEAVIRSVCANMAAHARAERRRLLDGGAPADDALVTYLDRLMRDFSSAANHFAALDRWSVAPEEKPEEETPAPAPSPRRSFPGDDTVCDPR